MKNAKRYTVIVAALAAAGLVCFGLSSLKTSKERQDREDREFVHDIYRDISGGDGFWSMQEKAHFLRFVGLDHVLQDGEHVFIRKAGPTITVTTEFGPDKVVTREKLEEYRPLEQ